jgi:hypothetical protein
MMMMMNRLKLVMLILLSMFSFTLKAQVGINTENPQAVLDVNGTVRMSNLGGTAPEIGSVLESANDKGDLKWVKNVAVPKMLFIQSNVDNPITPAKFNEDATTLHTAKFSSDSKSDNKTDVVNTIGAEFIGDNTIVIKHAGSYEISGYINYTHFYTYFNTDSEKIRFNLIVRKSTNGGATWTDIAGCRFSIYPIYNGTKPVSLQTITASLPPHIVTLEENSRIQYGFVKVSTETKDEMHGNVPFYVGAVADGMKYTNSLKLTKL